MSNKIIWYHGDWSQPTVMEASPHPEDWGVESWEPTRLAAFIVERNNEVGRLAASFGRGDWCGYHSHSGIFRAKAVVHTGVKDLGCCGLALISSVVAGTHATDVVAVVSPARLHRYHPKYIAGRAKFIAPEWRKKMHGLLSKHLGENDTLAFTAPVVGNNHRDAHHTVHDYQRALIRALVVSMKREDERAAYPAVA